MSDNNNLMLTLLSVSIGVLLINTILLVSHMKKDSRDHSKENFKDNMMWDNGGIYNGIGTDNNPFQTKLARSCSGYGVSRPLNQDMPFNNDSNLYTFNGNGPMTMAPRR
jgi:hypothetical protein